MATRIQAINLSIIGASNQATTFVELDMDAQTFLVHEAVVYNSWRASSTRTRIANNGAMSESEIATYRASGVGQASTPEQRTEYVINANNRRIPDTDTLKDWEKTAVFFEQAAYTQMFFLQSVANYVEAGDSYIEYDNGSFDPVAANIENDTMYSSKTATAQHPHAWARASLISKGVWPMETADDGNGEYTFPKHINNPNHLSKESFDLCATRVAGRYLSAAAVSIHTIGEIVPAKHAARDLIIASMSSSIYGLGLIKSEDSMYRALMTLSVANKAYNETKESMAKIWDTMRKQDKADAVIAKVDTDVAEVVTVVSDIMLDVRKMLAVEMGVQQILALGATPELAAKAKLMIETKLGIKATA